MFCAAGPLTPNDVPFGPFWLNLAGAKLRGADYEAA